MWPYLFWVKLMKEQVCIYSTAAKKAITFEILLISFILNHLLVYWEQLAKTNDV